VEYVVATIKIKYCKLKATLQLVRDDSQRDLDGEERAFCTSLQVKSHKLPPGSATDAATLNKQLF